MWNLLNGFRVTQCLVVVATLGVADLLEEGPKTAEELAARTGAHAGALYRVLRALASVGVFEEIAERRFTLTPLAAVLRADHPRSMRATAIFTGEEPYRSWAELLYSVRTGAPAFDHVYGAPHFDYLAQHPEASAMFDQSMSASSRQATSAIVGAYDFAAAGTVADVGGGQGLLLAAVLRANPALRGILFDQPHVVAGAEHVLAEAGVADRCARVGGDFFATAPSGADLYLLRRIIHDWDDERAITVLRNCARAMGSTAKVLVIESVIEAGNEASRAKFMDLQMLVMNGGRERTAEEYQRLFATAGLRLTRIIPTGSGESLIEGERAPGGG
jgi:hypothetical protein